MRLFFDPLSLKDQNIVCIKNAIKKGVKVVVGTDYVGWPVEQSAKEFRCLVEVGLSPMEAIKAGRLIEIESVI